MGHPSHRCRAAAWRRVPGGAGSRRTPARRVCELGPTGRGGSAQAIGSVLMNGRLSQLLPAATMQLRPLGVVLTTVQVFLSSEA